MALNPLSRSFIELVKASWEATSAERFRFFLFITLFICACIVDLTLPWAIGRTLDVYAKLGFTEEAFNQGMVGIGIYIALRLLHTCLHHTARYVQNTVTYTARMHTLEKIFASLLSYPLTWHVRHHSGENLSKLHRSAGAIEQTIGTYVWQIVEGVVKVIFAGVAIFALDFWVAVSVLVTSILTISAMIGFNKRLVNRIRRNFGFANKISRICVDYLFNIITVKTLALEKPAADYLRVQRDEGLALSKKISKYSELKWGSTTAGHGLVTGIALIIYFYGHRGSNLPFEIGPVYVLLSYLDRIFAAIGSFTGYYGGIIEASTAYEEATSITEQTFVHDKDRDSFRLNPNWNKLSIKNLNFTYDGGERPGLEDVSMDIFRGDTIALVGPSGGGKSTLLKILGGLLLPDTFHFSTDLQEKIPIYQIGQLSLLIPQEPEIFSETLYYNVTMGREFSKETIEHFARICRVETILSKLPLGWDTDLAEKGLNISVGEKQRVAMTRGLLCAKDHAIMLLDEPTSSLDPKTEKEVFVNIIREFRGRTIITACHRLNLVPLFDKVVYILNGRIEEYGKFNELVERGGYFARAWEDYQKRIVKE